MQALSTSARYEPSWNLVAHRTFWRRRWASCLRSPTFSPWWLPHLHPMAWQPSEPSPTVNLSMKWPETAWLSCPANKSECGFDEISRVPIEDTNCLSWEVDITQTIPYCRNSRTHGRTSGHRRLKLHGNKTLWFSRPLVRRTSAN